MKTQSHTPTPWQQGTTVNRKAMDKIFTKNGELEILKVDTSCPEPGENEANAAFIVRSTNNFDRMLAALKEVHWLTQGPSMEKQDAVMMQVLEAIREAEK